MDKTTAEAATATLGARSGMRTLVLSTGAEEVLAQPVLTRAAGVPMPTDIVFDAIERLHADLSEVRDLLICDDASVRQVLTPDAVVVRRDGDALTLPVSLPFADRGAVDLARHGDELVATVGSYRRLLALPVALRSARVVAASVRYGALVVGFVDDDGAPRL